MGTGMCGRPEIKVSTWIFHHSSVCHITQLAQSRQRPPEGLKELKKVFILQPLRKTLLVSPESTGKKRWVKRRQEGAKIAQVVINVKRETAKASDVQDAKDFPMDVDESRRLRRVKKKGPERSGDLGRLRWFSSCGRIHRDADGQGTDEEGRRGKNGC